MDDKKCLNCENVVVQERGKREKKFCSDSCRAAYHNKTAKKPPKYVQVKTVEKLKARISQLEAENLALKQNKPIPPKAEEKVKKGIQNHPNDKTTNDSTNGTEKHSLWKQGDPKENSAGFYMKYGASNYEELKNKKNEKDT